MYENPYLHYYRLQEGGNLAAFEGVRFQKGRGWFKKVGGKIMPALKYLGKNALSAATSFLGDIAAGRDVKTALKRTALEAGSRVADDIGSKARKLATKIQSGEGVRRKRPRKLPRKVKSTRLYKEPLKLVVDKKQKTRKAKKRKVFKKKK